MTKEQQEICRSLVILADGRRLTTNEEFLRQFPSAVVHGRLALRLLEEACGRRDAEDLHCALIVGHTFGFGPEHTDTLCCLVGADWHFSHEDIVSALDGLGSPHIVDALFHATQWIPDNLKYDKARALAVKAIWALGRIAGNEARQKLEMVLHCDDPVLQKNAEYQLKRRRR
jgi:hypothetical protein